MSQPPQMPNIDLNQLMQSAQQIAQTIPTDEKDRINNMNMDQMFNHVTDTVFTSMEQSGRQIDPATKSQMKVMSKAMLGQVMESMGEGSAEPKESKIDLGNLANKVTERTEGTKHKTPKKNDKFEEIADEEEVPGLRPRVDDIYYNLPVSLEDMYYGKTKKLAVKRSRIDKSGKKVKSEKFKIEVPIIRGVQDGQEIRFNREGDEKLGYESGDVVITLNQNNHEHFERHGNTLYTVKNISLYESYAAGLGLIKIVLKHLDGSYLYLKADDGSPLHSKDGARKVKGGGMPVYGSKKNEFGDLYVRFNVILPETFEGSDGEKAVSIIEKLFPVLPNNKSSLIHTDSEKKGFVEGPKDKVRDVKLEEVTEEDQEQLDYEEEEFSDEERSSDEYSDEYSDYSEESHDERRR